MAARIYRVVRWVVVFFFVAAIALVMRKSPPPSVDVTPAAKETLHAKLVEEQKATDAHEPHDLKMNEAELNSMLASNLALAPAPAPAAAAPAAPAGQGTNKEPAKATPAKDPTIEEVQSSVRDVKVTLVEDRVRAYVVFAFHGTDLSLVLEGRLSVRDNHLRFEPSAGKLGSLPLPQVALNNAVRRLFDSPENQEKFRVPPEIADIRVANNELVVSYR